MAYILALNPMILSAGGFDKGSVFLATIIATAIGCGIMGFWARTWPVALSSGMGLNGFIGFVVCGAMGYSPAEALGAITKGFCLKFDKTSSLTFQTPIAEGSLSSIDFNSPEKKYPIIELPLVPSVFLFFKIGPEIVQPNKL